MDIDRMATALLNADADRHALGPFSGSLDVRTGYRVQRAMARQRVQRGARPWGYKVGLTSRALQSRLSVDEPVYGVLFADRVADGPVALSSLLRPRLEVEIAFRMGTRLSGRGMSMRDAVHAVDRVLPAIEVADSRYLGGAPDAAHGVADNAWAARAALGGPGCLPDEADLAAVHADVVVDHKPVAHGSGGAVLGNPWNALVWLVGRLAADDLALEPGTVVLTGAMHAPIAVTEPQTVSADLGPVGRVEMRFV